MKKSDEFEFVLFPKYDVRTLPMPTWEFDYEENAEFFKSTSKLLDEADIIIIQAVHKYKTLGMLDAAIDKCGKKVISEFDDYFYAIPADHTAKAFFPNSDMEDIQLKQVLISQALIVSTPYLKWLLKDWGRQKQIFVVPNAIDFDIWGKLRRKKHEGIRIGWSGGMQHNRDLYGLRTIIPTICKKYKGVRFVVWGGHPDVFAGKYEKLKKYCEFPKWEPIDRYPKRLASLGLDIMISPLTDSLLNRGKSNLKWLEASALKIPFVGSPIEPYKVSIRHGENGFLAKSEQDWIDALSELIKDPQKRKSMANTAHEEVRRLYNAETVAENYLKILRAIRDTEYPNTYQQLGVEAVDHARA